MMRKIIIYIGMLLLFALPLAAVFAFNQSNDVSPLAGQPNECAGYQYELKFDSGEINDPTTKSAHGNTIRIDNFLYKDGIEPIKLDWTVTSGPGVLKVLVKTGDGDFPQTFTEFTKSGSVGPFDKMISHITFCWNDPTPPTPTPTITEEEKIETPTPTTTATSTSTSTSIPTETPTTTITEETPTPTTTSTEGEKEETSTPTPTSTEDQEDPKTPTPTPTDEDKEDTPTPTATEEADEPTPVVTPDAPAGGVGPSLAPRLMPLIIIVAGLAVTILLASAYRKKTE